VSQTHPTAIDELKDAYSLEFLSLPSDHTEDDLHAALLRNLGRFITELGRDFCFVGSEYPVQVGNQDFAIDLVFFHRGLSCLVAFELKVRKFEPADLGQLSFYVEALDRDVKKPHERPSIGVLFCASKMARPGSAVRSTFETPVCSFMRMRTGCRLSPSVAVRRRRNGLAVRVAGWSGRLRSKRHQLGRARELRDGLRASPARLPTLLCEPPAACTDLAGRERRHRQQLQDSFGERARAIPVRAPPLLTRRREPEYLCRQERHRHLEQLGRDRHRVLEERGGRRFSAMIDEPERHGAGHVWLPARAL
jgi:hypothetical protein